MDNKTYTANEMEFINSIENQIIVPLSPEKLEKEKQFFQTSARKTIKQRTKKRAFNIRLFESDINKIKAKALKEWLPYQTYLSSMVHKIATGKINKEIFYDKV